MRLSNIFLVPSLIISIFAISACEGKKTPTIVFSDTPPTNTATLSPTTTSLSTPIATIAPSQQASITERCPEKISLKDLSVMETNGVIVLLKGQYLDGIREAYFLDLANGNLSEFSQQGENLSFFKIAVSPDNKTLAYSVVLPKEETINLVLSNSAGERERVIPIESNFPFPEYGRLGGWLTNEKLLLDDDIYNPYTGEKQSFIPEDFPGISPTDFGVYVLQYDPWVTRVIYSHFGATTAMVDSATKQVLAKIPALNSGVPRIAWSYDGNLVAVVGAQTHDSKASDIFLIDRDGSHIRQMTELSSYYDTGYILFNPSWSPDGNHIAFWQLVGSMSTKRELRLFVLNIGTGELTSYCTWGGPKELTFYGPIWSPDSKHLLIGDFSIEGNIQAVIIDIDKNVAIPIAEDMIPVGWMVKP